MGYCAWAGRNEANRRYHDTEWGIPVHDDRISKDLKRRGFKYVGAVTIYSHLQACGIINDHDKDCPCYRKINEAYPTVKKAQRSRNDIFHETTGRRRQLWTHIMMGAPAAGGKTLA